MRIHRGPDPGPFPRYPQYKPHLKPLFRSRCAYCLSHDELLGGLEEMQVDHFRPTGRPEFAHLEHAWVNLYYSCRKCNRCKWHHWPSAQQWDQGLRFVDPCEDDPDFHIRLRTNCEVRHVTTAGKYTIARIQLNRKSLVDRRRERARAEVEAQAVLEDHAASLGLYDDETERLGSLSKLTDLQRNLARAVERAERELRKIVSFRTFAAD